ncbi:MAG: hypothetical protein AB1403_13065 [Candidatus Riflebacteria bacterium]
MRRFFLLAFSVFLFTSAVWAGAPEVDKFQDQLQSITDLQLRKTLENSIVSGLITDQQEFDAAVANAESRANQQAPVFYSARAGNNLADIRREIEELTKPIDGLDRDALAVEKNENFKDGKRGQKLFINIDATIPKSYDLTYDLCEKFNPKAGTNDAGRLNEDIDRFLAQMANDPVIKHALKSTDTTIEDLKANWFGSGLGFEHVVAGEVKGSKVSGYHWWYRFYRDERQGQAEVLSAYSDVDNDSIFTGSFNWDPDGSGPMPAARKPKGGFCNGNSVQALLAVGHIAIETARRHGSVPGAMTFYADINGETFTWQLYTMGGNIRSLYPMGKGKIDSRQLADSQDRIEFFDLEDEISNGNKFR